MWQRFTERSRKIVFYAQEEAHRFGHNYVAPEHLLLGMTREPGSVAEQLLQKVGVSLAQVRAEVESLIPTGASRPSQDMTLSPEAKLVIERAYVEARNLANNYIGSEHLLLGLVQDEDGIAGRVLVGLGVEHKQLCQETRLLQQNSASPGDGDSNL